MDLYITRHGESDSENYGGLDPYLTEKGNAQARLLGLRLSNIHFSCIYASPLIRAVQTAASVAREQEGSTRVIVLPQLYEIGTDKGYSYKSRDEILSFCPNAEIPSPLAVCEGIEGADACLQRAASVIEYVKLHHGENDSVLLTAHGSFNTFLILAALGFPFVSGFNFSQENTGLTLIRYITDNDGSPRTKLAYMNDASHLN